MALNYEELEEILQEISSEGWRSPLECLNNSSEKVPLVSQLVYDRDHSCLRLGTSENISSSSSQILSFLASSQKELASWIKSLWQEWQRSLVLGQLEYVYLPETLWQLFLEKKPPEFSLLQGEDLKDSSPFSEMWTKAPQASSCFLRVRDTRRVEEGSIDKGSFQDPEGRERFYCRELGSFQKASLATHQHTANFRQVSFIHRQRFLRVKKGVPILAKWDESFNNPILPQGTCDSLSFEDVASKDLRPASLILGVIWKKEEGSI